MLLKIITNTLKNVLCSYDKNRQRVHKKCCAGKKMDVRKYFAIALCKKNNWTYKNNSWKAPPCNVVLLFELPIENNKHPNFEWREARGVDCFVLRSYPIWGRCVNSFVANFSYVHALSPVKRVLGHVLWEPGARFSKVPVTLRARNQIFK